MTLGSRARIGALSALVLVACGYEEPEEPPALATGTVHELANGCYAVAAGEKWLAASEDGFAFSAGRFGASSRFFLKASDLGTYLFYDAEGRYLVAEDGALVRQADLLSDILTIDDTYVSGAEWELEASEDAKHFRLKNLKSGEYLTASAGFAADAAGAAALDLYTAKGCAEHPELSLDAEGEIVPDRFDDGSVFGIVDTHSHLLTNFAFGGGGVFHGAPFHRLGVRHALPDCAMFHGEEGRKDLLGFGYDKGREGDFDTASFVPALLLGSLGEFQHHTAGWPDFTDWPNAPGSSTHQTQYYRWLERAYLGGLRLVVQHATSNSVMCEIMIGQGIQQARYDCNDMVATDRSIEEAYNLERYIDAQNGGPGQGWFRIVTTPEQARTVIDDGKLAVILGIEVSNLFDCFLVPRAGYATCDDAFIAQQVQKYYDLGVRAIFPVHKYDNAFSAGDGHRAISEVGNFANSGHWSSFGLDCPADVTAVFDKGDVVFGGLNQPRPEYFATPPNDMSNFADGPIPTLLPFLPKLQEPALVGSYCQSHGMTAQGETLMKEMMTRGMIIEIDHLPQWSYHRAFEILEENDYPAAATHGSQYNGKLYALGGVSKTNLGRCADPANPSAMAGSIPSRVAQMEQMGAYPAVGFGFDLNGFAGAAGPRFGENSECSEPQENPITYPFVSYRGDVTFTEPKLANRTVDFNTEGMVHIGMLPELIEDARRTGVTDEELEPLFRSAEGYLRMWEKAEQRAQALR